MKIIGFDGRKVPIKIGGVLKNHIEERNCHKNFQHTCGLIIKLIKLIN